QGIAIGKSKLDEEMIGKLKGLELTSSKLHLPVDVVVARKASEDAVAKVSAVGNVEDNEIILDIGPDTIELFSHIVEKARTIIWNGPLGFSEIPQFSHGTFEFAKVVAKSKAFTIVGGGESVAALDALGLSKKIGFISTGGGAMLDLLAGEPMPGIEALMRNKKKL
ncbi:MAG TPA: phosphoglycerate kinase, partial [Acidobacteriota bacterium]